MDFGQTFLTKKYILDNLSQESIFAIYWGISENDIDNCVRYNTLICSPIRVDNNPSMGFTIKAGKLICRDFAGYFWGDCFDAVAYTLNLDANNGHNFMLILTDIAKRFGMSNGVFPVKERLSTKTLVDKPATTFIVIPREWNKNDAQFWHSKYTLTRDELNAYQVYPIYQLYINGTCRYWYNSDDPAYGYYLGNKNGLDIWKIYFPYRDKYRFMTNSPSMQGLFTIRKADIGIIIKSYKDVMVGRKLARLTDASVDFVANSSENIIPSQSIIEYLYTFWDEIWVFSDFDKTGRKFARLMRKNYGINSLFLTNGILGTLNFESKDLSDYLANNGLEKSLKLFTYVYENGIEITSHFLNFNETFLHHKFGT